MPLSRALALAPRLNRESSRPVPHKRERLSSSLCPRNEAKQAREDEETGEEEFEQTPSIVFFSFLSNLDLDLLFVHLRRKRKRWRASSPRPRGSSPTSRGLKKRKEMTTAAADAEVEQAHPLPRPRAAAAAALAATTAAAVGPPSALTC